MFATLDFQNKLNSDDIIVWNGVISKWHFVRDHVLEGDMVRMADDEEIEHYKSINNKNVMTEQARRDMDMLSFYSAVNKMRVAQKQIAEAKTTTLEEVAKVRNLENTIDGMVKAFNDYIGTKDPYPTEGLYSELIKNIQ